MKKAHVLWVRNGSANNAGNQIVYERLYVQNSPKRLYVSTKAKRQLPAFQGKCSSREFQAKAATAYSLFENEWMLEREKKAQTNEAERSTIRQHCCVHRKIKMLSDFELYAVNIEKLNCNRKRIRLFARLELPLQKHLNEKHNKLRRRRWNDSQIMRLHGWKL